MEIPHNYLENLQVHAVSNKIRNYRDELITTALDEINKARVGTDYRPLTFVAVKRKVAHLSDFDLSWLNNHAKKASCGFSRAWFGSLKAR